MGAIHEGAPVWTEWRAVADRNSLGVEEEIMLLHPHTTSLAPQIDRVLAALPAELNHHANAETHGSALELATGVHPDVGSAMRELASLREQLEAELDMIGLRAAVAGTHATAVWQETTLGSGDRQRSVYGSMRELARREPTFALHVHVGVPDPQRAIELADRLRAHLPLLLALSSNSPFWQGRDTGLASARTPLFQAFPRVGIPRRFGTYETYCEAVDLLIRCDAIEEPTFLWWDVRPQPRIGTVEVRIMDAQTRIAETAALVALTQSLARLELEEGYVSEILVDSAEVLEENRFIAARDGVDGRLIDPEGERRVPVREITERLLESCAPHAQDLGCEAELEGIRDLLEESGADRQRRLARGPGRVEGVIEWLAGNFSENDGAAAAG
jgi:carboxylate-amine ligase